MIPDLALIIGAYVIVRMLQIIVKTEPKEHGFVVALALITILLTIGCVADIIFRGGEAASSLQKLQEQFGPK